jgi:hypothetical protein
VPSARRVPWASGYGSCRRPRLPHRTHQLDRVRGHLWGARRAHHRDPRRSSCHRRLGLLRWSCAHRCDRLDQRQRREKQSVKKPWQGGRDGECPSHSIDEGLKLVTEMKSRTSNIQPLAYRIPWTGETLHTTTPTTPPQTTVDSKLAYRASKMHVCASSLDARS